MIFLTQKLKDIIKKSLALKIFLAIALFSSTFFILGYATSEMWYREDDLGQIINGIIRTKDDFIRVFSSDERDLICPENYRRSKPNVLSGFVRPLKNVFFTITYYLYGLDVLAFYRLHVLVHAFNVALCFLLFSFWLPASFALLGALMFAFYPDMTWLAWMATLHNSLTVLFLLLSLICYRFYWIRTGAFSSAMFVISGGMFGLALLSREDAVFFPFWLVTGVFLLLWPQRKSVWQLMITTLSKTWIFFVMHALYVLLRLCIFGTATLTRTFNNLFLRFPFLNQFFAQTKPAVAQVQSVSSAVVSVPSTTTTVTQVASVVKPSLFASLGVFVERKISTLTHWSSIIFNTPRDTFIVMSLWLLLIAFFVASYRYSKRLFLFFVVGVLCFIWPAVLAYPSTRYMNCTYPIFAALTVFGLYAIYMRYTRNWARILFMSVFVVSTYSIFNGIEKNVRGIAGTGASMLPLKKRYEQFFATYSFPKKANFIVFSSPFVSDIQNTFHYFLNDLTVKVSNELFSTLAQGGIFGCRGDYRIKGVRRDIVPIEAGFRIKSQNKDHCACWMNYSHFPMWWSEKDKAYEWRQELYQVGVWYPCSMGKFKIHERLDNRYITDVSFVFDQKWIDEDTVFVTWDTIDGKYVVLPSDHLKG